MFSHKATAIPTSLSGIPQLHHLERDGLCFRPASGIVSFIEIGISICVLFVLQRTISGTKIWPKVVLECKSENILRLSIFCFLVALRAFYTHTLHLKTNISLLSSLRVTLARIVTIEIFYTMCLI